MKTKSYVILLLAALGFTACKRDSEKAEDRPLPQGRDAHITLNIKRSSGLTTYASSDPNATNDEIQINRVDVFIFDNGAPFGVLHTEITDPEKIYADPADGPDSDLLPITDIPAKTGTKRIYVGINLTATAINKIMENYAYLTDGITVAYNDLVNASGNVAMFNEKDFNDPDVPNSNVLDIVETPGPADNKITINVSRMVAKVAVKTDAALELHIPGGTLSDLQFTTGQTNKKLHPAPLVGYKDANWGATTYLASDFNMAATVPAYQTVNSAAAFDNSTAILAANKIYLQENTSELHRHQEVSYITVRAVFTPTTDAVDPSVTPGPTPITTGDTFIAVFSNGNPGIGVHYFHIDDEALANDYAADHAGVAITYPNGYCYYRLYLNPAPAAGRGNPYDILRNVFYKANITKISTIGTPNPDLIPGEEGTPAFPGLPVITDYPEVLPSDVINPPKNAAIEATIEIVPWIDQPENYEL